MLFNSFIFLFFLAAVVPIYYLLPHRYRNAFLLVCSYFFYAYWDWRFLSLIWISTAVDFTIGKKMYGTRGTSKRKRLLAVSIIANLGLLGFFKYFNFFTESFNQFIGALGFRPLDSLHLNIILPIGISFYTFQTLSYTIDIYREKLKPEDSPINFALFVAFFPQLVAGPIERAVNLLPQIQSKIKFSKEKFREGVVLISVGMFKKIVLGDTCGHIVDHIFAQPQYYSSLEMLMALLLFSVQIYNDFSGYSHIARGTAKLLGFELMINFQQPYLATSIGDFWKRWHISLSSWFMDYLYLPVAYSLSRRIKTRTLLGFKAETWAYVVGTLITMMLCGLWHGAGWTFFIWGLMHGLYMTLSFATRKLRAKVRKSLKIKKNAPVPDVFRILAVFVMVNFAWIFFRADSFGTAFYFIKSFLNWSPGGDTTAILGIIATYFLATVVIDLFERYTGSHTFLLRLTPPYRYGIIMAGWFLTLLYLYGSEPMPFVYFQF